MRNRLIFCDVLMVFFRCFGRPSTRRPRPAQSAPDSLSLDQESKFQREKTEYLQENIIDKILGPGKPSSSSMSRWAWSPEQ